MDKLKKFFNDLLTEPNNKTPCFIRWFTFLGGFQGLASHAWGVFVLHTPFDFQAYGIGLGATIAAIGVALGLKKDSQPDDK